MAEERHKTFTKKRIAVRRRGVVRAKPEFTGKERIRAG